MKRYIKVWLIMSKNSFLRDFNSKLGLFLLLLGKFVRFVIFAVFLFYLLSGIGSLAGYSREQVIFIFLTFNLLDILSQFLLREVYRFRPQIISGDFDLVLVKPIKPLFRAAFGGADFIDFLTIPPLFVAIVFFGNELNPSVFLVLAYIILVINGLVLAISFHILILAFAVLTLELDSVLWLFRELLNLGKIPLEVYRQPLRTVLVYLLPVAIMIAVPAKTLIGLSTFKDILVSVFVTIIFSLASLKFWDYSLSRYTSASS